MSTVKCCIHLFVLTNVFIISQFSFYQNQDSDFVFKINESLSFTEAKKFCNSLRNGTLALIKSRTLAGQIEDALSKTLHQLARK